MNFRQIKPSERLSDALWSNYLNLETKNKILKTAHYLEANSNLNDVVFCLEIREARRNGTVLFKHWKKWNVTSEFYSQWRCPLGLKVKFRYLREKKKKKILVSLGLRGFSVCRTSSAKTRQTRIVGDQNIPRLRKIRIYCRYTCSQRVA